MCLIQKDLFLASIYFIVLVKNIFEKRLIKKKYQYTFQTVSINIKPKNQKNFLMNVATQKKTYEKKSKGSYVTTQTIMCGKKQGYVSLYGLKNRSSQSFI